MSRVVRVILATMLAAFAVSLAPARAAQAPTVTIHELKTNWQRYDGKTVQVRGQLDDCQDGIYGLECDFCPETMTAAIFDWNFCLSFVFADEPISQKAPAIFSVTHINEEMYRFATVTIQATFDATSLYDESGKSVHANPVLFYDGGLPDLMDAHVLQVHSRKTARDGIATGTVDPLIVAMPEERDAMLQSFVQSYQGDSTPVYTYEVFAIRYSQAEIDEARSYNLEIPDGVGCVCLAEQCQGLWLTRWFRGVKSPANPFRCWEMQKKDGHWIVMLEEN